MLWNNGLNSYKDLSLVLSAFLAWFVFFWIFETKKLVSVEIWVYNLWNDNLRGCSGWIPSLLAKLQVPGICKNAHLTCEPKRKHIAHIHGSQSGRGSILGKADQQCQCFLTTSKLQRTGNVQWDIPEIVLAHEVAARLSDLWVQKYVIRSCYVRLLE